MDLSEKSGRKRLHNPYDVYAATPHKIPLNAGFKKTETMFILIFVVFMNMKKMELKKPLHWTITLQKTLLGHSFAKSQN